MDEKSELLESAKKSAVKMYMPLDGVMGVGIGDGKIRVYVLNPEVAGKVADEIDGVPIEKVVTGDIESQ